MPDDTTWLTIASTVAFFCALLPIVLSLRNFRYLTPPPPATAADGTVADVSLLIPARNEELSIRACLEAARASVGANLEIVVLDDQSTDSTADIVRELAKIDPRIRLESSAPLPEGWCGKQYACWQLSKLARNPVLVFIDADVRLSPDCLARMVLFLRDSGAALVSAFPRQETGTILEKMLIPLIHFILMGYLPLDLQRRTRLVGFAAGCGQLFVTSRQPYEAVGGHAAVKASLHDGIKLPRAYRRIGLPTDLCDGSEVATCRMYRTGGQTWSGLAKNAREGLAANGPIVPMSVLLFCGQVLPFVLLPILIVRWSELGFTQEVGASLPMLLAAVLGAWGVRHLQASQFGLSRLGAWLHPAGVFLLLTIQWYAVARSILGIPPGWKGRTYPAKA